MSNLIFTTWFFKNQVQINRGSLGIWLWINFDTHQYLQLIVVRNEMIWIFDQTSFGFNNLKNSTDEIFLKLPKINTFLTTINLRYKSSLGIKVNSKSFSQWGRSWWYVLQLLWLTVFQPDLVVSEKANKKVRYSLVLINCMPYSFCLSRFWKMFTLFSGTCSGQPMAILVVEFPFGAENPIHRRPKSTKSIHYLLFTNS